MKPKSKRILRYSALALFLLGGFWVAKLVWLRPFNINHFYERIFVEFALENPELLSSIKPPFIDKVSDYASRLTDASMAHNEKMADLQERDLQLLCKYNRKKLKGQDQLSYDILHWFLNHGTEGQEFLYHNYPLNQFSGLQSDLPSFMESTHAIHTREDANNYLLRLRAFRKKFDQALEGLRYREEQGIIPPRFVVEKVLVEMKAFVETKPTENILYQSFARKAVATDPVNLNEAEQATFLEHIAKSVERDVYPAYRRLIEYYESLLPKTTEEAGVWKLPKGEEFYNYSLKTHTTTNLTADEIHRTGLEEVDKIQARVRQILDSLGIQGKTVGEHLSDLSSDEQFHYPDSDSGRQQCIADYQSIIDEAQEMVVGLFNVKPESRVRVERIPKFKEQTAPGAYYQAPALDGSRDGVFYANLRNMQEVPKWGMRTLAYHEAVPGHHFQIAIQQELKGLPTFRKVIPFTAYSEGWALYAEYSAMKINLHADPYSLLGYYQAQLFRAVRLVVDTGIHSKRWTREEAIDYMKANTGMGDQEVVAEVERYIVYPGQACAYKIGQLKILELKKKASEELGRQFFIQEFHDLILNNGSMPLEVLEEVVNHWIEERKQTST